MPAPKPPITQAITVRSLTPEEAAEERPVRLRGVVTFFDPFRRYAFLQDETAGVFFYPGSLEQPGPLSLAAGDLVEIEGLTWPGGYAPTVEAGGGWGMPVKAKVLGRAPLPEPAVLPWNELDHDAYHSRFVELRGVVRSMQVQSEEANLILEVSTRGGLVRAFVPSFTPPQRLPKEWIDVEARLRGVFSVGGDQQRQRSERRLFVQTLESIGPDFEAVAAAFAQPPRLFHSLLRFDAGRSPEARVHVAGVITHHLPGRGVFLREADRGLWVQTVQKLTARPGDRASAIGFAVMAEQRAILQDAILRKGERGAAPVPIGVSIAQARSGAHHGDLVQLHGELLDHKAQAGEPALVIAAEGGRFHVEVPPEGRGQAIRKHSWLSVSGICLNEPPPPGAGLEAATEFRILMRSPADLAVLREAAWWTPQKIAAIVGALLVVTAGVGAWGFMLRRRVAQQTAIIQQKLEKEVVWEERNRIARELHDSLEQHLAAITMQLESVGTAPGDLPESARASLGRVRAMVQHSRGEARQSVWDLRSHALEQGGLPVALRECAAALEGDPAPAVEIGLRGKERRLDRQVEFHLLRVAQEAMTNAVKHARASRITIEIDYQADAVCLVIRDDGAGFDAAQVAGAKGAHFGLLGMRERATKMKGSLSVESAPGQGTTISLRVPLASTNLA